MFLWGSCRCLICRGLRSAEFSGDRTHYNLFFMMLNLSKHRTVGFLIFITTILVINTIPAKAAIPNLDGESRPNRLKLNECIADVKEVTAWDEKQTLAAARDVCKVRQNHAQQKARFLAAQKKLTQEYQNYTNHGFNKHLPIAIEDSWTIVKSCIDLKEGFTSPHNIGVLEVPETIRSQCYSIGANLIESNLLNQP